MHRVFDCARPEDGSPMAPPSVLPSASDNGVGTSEDLISQLNTGPTCAPVNASPAPLPVRTQDSGSGRLAGSSLVRLSHPRLLAGFKRRTIRPVDHTSTPRGPPATAFSRRARALKGVPGIANPRPGAKDSAGSRQ
jgi:hypothetical protein